MNLLTIGIPSLNRPKAAKDALSYILQSEFLSSNTILLVNNGSTEEYELTELRVNYGEKFRYIKFEENLGFGMNLIRLLELCETKYLLFMSDEDDLTEVGFNSLSNLLTIKKPTLVILRDKRKRFKQIYRLNQNNVKGESSYISGIIVNIEILRIHMDLLKHLIQTEEFASLYPQVIMSTLLNSIQSGYVMSEPTIVKRVELPTTVTSKNGTPYWYPTERVMQHLSFQRCIAELMKNVDSKTKKHLKKLSNTLDSNFFGLIYDAIRTISPNLQPILVRSSLKTIINFYYRAFKKQLRSLVPKNIRNKVS